MNMNFYVMEELVIKEDWINAIQDLVDLLLTLEKIIHGAAKNVIIPSV